MGVPALNSYWDLLPQGTDFQKQVYKVLQGELALNTEPLQFTPFLICGINISTRPWSAISPSMK
jgi:hypothetical protein